MISGSQQSLDLFPAGGRDVLRVTAELGSVSSRRQEMISGSQQSLDLFPAGGRRCSQGHSRAWICFQQEAGDDLRVTAELGSVSSRRQEMISGSQQSLDLFPAGGRRCSQGHSRAWICFQQEAGDVLRVTAELGSVSSRRQEMFSGSQQSLDLFPAGGRRCSQGHSRAWICFQQEAGDDLRVTAELGSVSSRRQERDTRSCVFIHLRASHT
ncbi:unnamed protein product [Pleuronectes platessa]|uniref:Uncharacterized protein n=1 Tax=Pleuronectes platessa TaxID=8262 RepID=A0A9N7Y7X9_PLEPL|nr:unnamed protein product [Pleuronectes platessa]